MLAGHVRRHAPGERLLEAGCGLGVTSLLAGGQFRISLLDIESGAIEQARQLYTAANRIARFVQGDLFTMPFENDSFDCVFNAGVLEHFNFQERCAALREMGRVARKGGSVIVAVPNHFSAPYRYSYERLVKKARWGFPLENRIKDLDLEASQAGNLSPVSRETIDDVTIFHFLKRMHRLAFRFLHLFGRYEGYLAIFTLRKH
jgi:ubiquinone/menaquinone biosynthesis C-methylase UbiE